MLLKRAHINKVKVIRKYLSSTLTEIFTSQKTLGQCTVQIFAKSLTNDGKNPSYVPRHFLLCEIVGKGHERAQGLYKCSLISGMLPCLFQEMKIITLLSSVRAWKNILGPGS